MGDILHDAGAAAVRDLRLVRSSLAKCQTADLVLRKTTAMPSLSVAVALTICSAVCVLRPPSTIDGSVEFN